MSDLGAPTTPETVPIPRQLESPPRTTGNAQMDFPIVIDWLWRAYQIIAQAVNYINAQIEDNPDININDLPDPATSTVAQAQTTANQAYALATQAQNTANSAKSDAAALKNRLDGFTGGTFTIADFNTTASVNIPTQADVNYRVMVQPRSSVGSPEDEAFTIRAKTYATSNFSVTLLGWPGAGNSVTFDWQLVRNT